MPAPVTIADLVKVWLCRYLIRANGGNPRNTTPYRSPGPTSRVGVV